MGLPKNNFDTCHFKILTGQICPTKSSVEAEHFYLVEADANQATLPWENFEKKKKLNFLLLLYDIKEQVKNVFFDIS